MKTIAIIGLGYVGLPLALQFSRSGATVIGIDIDPAKVDALKQGRSYIKHITPEAIREQFAAGRLSATTDFAAVQQVDAVIICVPTPLNKNREPDISFIMSTGKALALHLRPGVLVDSKADILVYGIGETATLEIFHRLERNEDLGGIPGTVRYLGGKGSAGFESRIYTYFELRN